VAADGCCVSSPCAIPAILPPFSLFYPIPVHRCWVLCVTLDSLLQPMTNPRHSLLATIDFLPQSSNPIPVRLLIPWGIFWGNLGGRELLCAVRRRIFVVVYQGGHPGRVGDKCKNSHPYGSQTMIAHRANEKNQIS